MCFGSHAASVTNASRSCPARTTVNVTVSPGAAARTMARMASGEASFEPLTMTITSCAMMPALASGRSGMTFAT